MAKSIMIQGTGSYVGKSVIVAGLCRILKQDGFFVAPFKAQNMALNSYITAEGDEIGRAQAMQAEASGIIPTVDINPVLLKSNSDNSVQVIIKGKVHAANISGSDYYRMKDLAWEAVRECYSRLSSQYEVIVIEGAGSPAEVNLKEHDIVNMRVAEMSDAPVILVADIDRGGVFASIIGTLELLEEDERQRIAGFIINKFRGNLSLLRPGLDFLEKKTGRPVLGVVPFFKDIYIQEEDGVVFDRAQSTEYRVQSTEHRTKLNIAVVRLPHISNFTDFDPFRFESDAKINYVNRPENLRNADAIMLPGTKNTIEDLIAIKNSGIADVIVNMASKGIPVIGICGGYQMLGKVIKDPYHVETHTTEIEGLGLLDIETTLEKEKITSQVEAELVQSSELGVLKGYEIHMGKTLLGNGVRPLFSIRRLTNNKSSETSNHQQTDGAINPDGRIWGCYIHGLFDNDWFRRKLINLWRNDCLQKTSIYQMEREKGFNKLASLLRKHIDMSTIYRIMDNLMYL